MLLATFLNPSVQCLNISNSWTCWGRRNLWSGIHSTPEGMNLTSIQSTNHLSPSNTRALAGLGHSVTRQKKAGALLRMQWEHPSPHKQTNKQKALLNDCIGMHYLWNHFLHPFRFCCASLSCAMSFTIFHQLKNIIKQNKNWHQSIINVSRDLMFSLCMWNL